MGQTAGFPTSLPLRSAFLLQSVQLQGQVIVPSTVEDAPAAT